MAGTVKFESGFPLETLVDIVQELKGSSPSRWVDLHIRAAGAENRYIGFHYILDNGSKKVSKKANHKLIGFLKEKLGTRPGNTKCPSGVTGWSISTVQVVV